VLTDVCLTGVLTDVCLTGVLTDLCLTWYIDYKNYTDLLSQCGVRGCAVGSGTALQAGRSRVRFAMVLLEFFIDIILSAALCLTQPLREMSTRNISLGVKAAGA